MKVLVAFEESQEVCKAFRNVGDIAFSCDLQACSGGRPEWHIQDDVLNVLYDNWDLVIAFPPCTFLSNVNSPIMNEFRKEEMFKGSEFFKIFLNLSCPYCVENPKPMKAAGLPDHTQYIEPYYFGHPYTKKIGLWLHWLPPLYATNIVRPSKGSYVFSGSRTSLYRSKTLPSIAQAMAAQWSPIPFNLCRGV